METTIEQKEKALMAINFYIGGLREEQIEYWYDQLIIKNKNK